MMRNGLSAAAVLLSVLIPASAGAQQGQRAVRIDDGAQPICINSDKHKISLTLRRFTVKRESSWFTQDKKATLYLGTTLGGTTPTSQETTSIAKALQANLSKYNDGIAQIAIESALLNQYPLKRENNITTNVNLAISLVKEQGETTATKIIRSMATVGKSINIPLNPYTEGFRVASSYVTSVIEPLVAASKEKDEASEAAAFQLNFGSSDTCSGDKESAGTKVVIFAASGTDASGYVDINALEERYCAPRVTLKPSFSIQYAPKGSGGDCSNATYRELANPHIAFFLNAEETRVSPPNVTAALPPPSVTRALEANTNDLRSALAASGLTGHALNNSARVVDRMATASPASQANLATQFPKENAYFQSLKRCEANGIEATRCFSP